MDHHPDAIDAVRQIYLQYLDERFSAEPVTIRHRTASFDSEHPAPPDAAKINAGLHAYGEGIDSGMAELDASAKAGKAFWGQHYREQIEEREVDRRLSKINPEYRARVDAEIEKKVEQQLLERDEQRALTNAHGVEGTRHAEPQPAASESRQPEEIDWPRYTQDKEYQRYVNDSLTKPHGRDRTGDHSRTL